MPIRLVGAVLAGQTHAIEGRRDRRYAAEALEAKLDEVLNSADHRWFLNKLDPAEQQERERRREEFQKRYGH